MFMDAYPKLDTAGLEVHADLQLAVLHNGGVDLHPVLLQRCAGEYNATFGRPIATSASHKKISHFPKHF